MVNVGTKWLPAMHTGSYRKMAQNTPFPCNRLLATQVSTTCCGVCYVCVILDLKFVYVFTCMKYNVCSLFNPLQWFYICPKGVIIVGMIPA